MLERRKLVKLETALGLLGWQQADYQGETQEHVQRLTDFEREESRLTNESAEIGMEIRQIEEERSTLEREFEEAQARALAAAQPTAADATALEEQAAAKRKEHKELAARLAVLDRELRDTEREYRELVIQATPQSQDEVLRLRKVIRALPRERAEWQTKLDGAGEQLAAMETLLEALRDAHGRFEKKDRELADEIAARLRKKQKVEKQIDAVEKSKADPYLEIGRALADHNVSPLNQPEALKAVHAQRLVVAGREFEIAASTEASRQEDRALVWKSWLLAGALLLLGAIVVFVAAQKLF
jgi:chromosome segregation ATPase